MNTNRTTKPELSPLRVSAPPRASVKSSLSENQIGTEVVDAAVKIHRDLGPGLLESVYEVLLSRELETRGLSVQRQVAVPIEYGGIRFDEGFRVDIIVESLVILELKSVEQLNKTHHKQLFTYLKLKALKLGYLLNFGAPLMRDGIVRIVHGLEEPPLRVSASLREPGFQPLS